MGTHTEETTRMHEWLALESVTQGVAAQKHPVSLEAGGQRESTPTYPNHPNRALGAPLSPLKAAIYLSRCYILLLYNYLRTYGY